MSQLDKIVDEINIINLTIVECKFNNRNSGSSVKYIINLTIVECKCVWA